MLNLWLVVLLGFVASARGGGGGSKTWMSHKAVEDVFKAACTNESDIKADTNGRSSVVDDVVSGGAGVAGKSVKSLTDIKINKTRVDSLKLRDTTKVFINLTVTLSSIDWEMIKFTLSIDVGINWGISTDGHLEADAGKVAIRMNLVPSNKAVIPAPLFNSLHAACEPLLQTHLRTYLKGVMRGFNKRMEYGSQNRNALLRSVAIRVSADARGLLITHKTIDKNGKEVDYPNNDDPAPKTEGSLWFTYCSRPQLKCIWDKTSPKTQYSEWPVSRFEKLFGSDTRVTLGSYLNVTRSLGDARTFNIKSDGIHMETDLNLTISSESGNLLLRIFVSVNVLVNLKSINGGVGFDLRSIRPSVDADMKVTWKHNKCACDNILNEFNWAIDIDIDGFGSDFDVLYSPGVPSAIADYYDPVFGYQPGDDNKGYCTMEYLRPIY